VRLDCCFCLLALAGLFFCVGCSDGRPQQPTGEVFQTGDPLAPGGGGSSQNGDPKPIIDPATGRPNAPSLNHGSLPVVDPITLPTVDPPTPITPISP